MDENKAGPSQPQKNIDEITLKEYIEQNEKTLTQIVQFINLNINQRVSRLEGNILEIKK